MTGTEFFKTFLGGLVELEVKKALPFVTNLIPGVTGQFLTRLTASPEVQSKLAAWEQAGVDVVVNEVAKGIHWLTELVEGHVSGHLRDVVHEVLSASPPGAAHLTADQVKALALLAAAGKLDKVLEQGLKDLGLLPV